MWFGYPKVTILKKSILKRFKRVWTCRTYKVSNQTAKRLKSTLKSQIWVFVDIGTYTHAGGRIGGGRRNVNECKQKRQKRPKVLNFS